MLIIYALYTDTKRQIFKTLFVLNWCRIL